MTISNPVNANITQATASGTILNDDDSSCPDNLHITGVISSNTYHAAQNITSDGAVPNGNSVIFKAGTGVELQPGFEVSLGATLEVIIEGCTPLIPPLPAEEKK